MHLLKNFWWQHIFANQVPVIFDQTRKNGYQIISFDVYIHDLMIVFILGKCSENSLGVVVILPLIHIGNLYMTFLSLKDWTGQN